MRLFGKVDHAINRYDRAVWLSGLFDLAFAAVVPNPTPDPGRATWTRPGPDPFRATSARTGPDPFRATSRRFTS